ncbi:hypothetical protein BT96DRAFT_840092, partial [Gymnopus androsaceus JB14]
INGQVIPVTLKNTLYAPDAMNNLLSVSRIDDGGGELNFKSGQVQLFDMHKNLLINGEKKHCLYYLKAHAREAEHANAASDQEKSHTWEEWHRKYGHIGNSTLETLQKDGLVEGLNVDLNSPHAGDCEACIWVGI